jgi:hypothetical protein
MIHYICALKCEASPLIEHYQLKHIQKAELFNIYMNNENGVSLTITGVGKLAAAMATTYTYTFLQCEAGDVWINMGVAGHATHNIGDIYIANCIEDISNTSTWYPQLVIDTSIPTAGLQSLDQPSTEYNNTMYDMEAAGFIFSASRFATSELSHSIKVISDNQLSPTDRLSARMISKLIDAAKEPIVMFASQLETLSLELSSDFDISDDFQLFTTKWHFTQYQQNELKKLLHRHHLLAPTTSPIKSISSSCNKAKEVLDSLQTSLDNIPFYLAKQDV